MNYGITELQNPMKHTHLILATATWAALASSSSAQVHPAALASLTSDGQFSTVSMADEALIAKCSTASSGAPWLPSAGWRAWLGDMDGDGALDVPGDVDALALIDRTRGVVPSNLVFSFLQNEGPFEDGDLLRRMPDGQILVWLAEATLRQVLGTTTTALDIDAATVLPGSVVAFSLASNLATSAIGAVSDGDILTLDANGVVSVLHSEADLQAMAEAALGGGIGPIGDCIALSQDPTDGTLVFVIQSPSAHDATAIRVSGSTTQGFLEAEWGFSGAAELDALAMYVGSCDVPARLSITPDVVPAQQYFTIDVQGGQAGGLFFLLFGATRGEIELPGLTGFSALFIDAGDVIYQTALSGWSELIGRYDSQGSAQFPVHAAALLSMPFDLTFQVLDLQTSAISAPAVITIQ